MKIYVDVKKMLGEDIRFMNARPWLDFNDKSKVLGARIECVALDRDYEKFTVKVHYLVEHLKSLKKNQKIQFKGLEGVVYSFSNNLKVSYTAEDLII